MNEQDSFFERTEQQILFYLYDNRDHAVSKTELRKNIDTAPAESTLVKKLIEFDTYGNVAIA